MTGSLALRIVICATCGFKASARSLPAVIEALETHVLYERTQASTRA